MESFETNDHNQNSIARNIPFFVPFPFQNLLPTLPRMQLSHWVTSQEWLEWKSMIPVPSQYLKKYFVSKIYFD